MLSRRTEGVSGRLSDPYTLTELRKQKNYLAARKEAELERC
jgi:hypothetical protein